MPIPSIERILAPNPGPYTGPGTNTYLLELDQQMVVIDPGPIIASHQTAILEQIGSRQAAAVIVTHTHPDHAPLANPLARELVCPAYGFSPGPDFVPDLTLSHNQVLSLGKTEIKVIYTPGHADDHICLQLDDVLFTGDHILGGTSVMVQDMQAYMTSLYNLQDLTLRRLYPGHGPEIDQPTQAISWYLAHRLQREQQILAVVVSGVTRMADIVEQVYTGVDPSLLPLATISTQAHLRKLHHENKIHFEEANG